ncbi:MULTISPECIES: hypothetical protein [unclassified Leptospira]|uniref:hypothetical protein n=1 Tax=unclassified Leptospira TaxID=2633828 RepID=UPI0002BE2FD0|nr:MULTISPECIES: hypothetical protein [unclassified Leptospira]EMK01231.1 hypothetical protein LEP1GSC192_1173 [Leptospira sp. B5-022]MCR1795454.1 hypothetical protein [Leptospira sp. id769339]
MDQNQIQMERLGLRYQSSRKDGVGIGIESITLSFPIEDVEKVVPDENSEWIIDELDIPDLSTIKYEVKGRKFFVTYPLAQFLSGFALPTDSSDLHEEFYQDLERNQYLNGYEIHSFENMEVESVHLIQAVKIDVDHADEIRDLENWIMGQCYQGYQGIEKSDVSINGAKVRCTLTPFRSKDQFNWKNFIRDGYQFELGVILENSKSIKDSFGRNKVEALTVHSIQEVMRKNAKSLFDSMGYLYTLVDTLGHIKAIQGNLGSIFRVASEMDIPESLDIQKADLSLVRIKEFEESIKNIKAFEDYICELSGWLLGNSEHEASVIRSLAKIGKALVGPEFEIELENCNK